MPTKSTDPTDAINPTDPNNTEIHVALDVPDAKAKAAAPRDKAARPKEEEADPKLPHERDESAGMTDGTPSPAMQQAHKDLKRGLQDTGRAPEADRAYRKLKG